MRLFPRNLPSGALLHHLLCSHHMNLLNQFVTILNHNTSPTNNLKFHSNEMYAPFCVFLGPFCGYPPFSLVRPILCGCLTAPLLTLRVSVTVCFPVRCQRVATIAFLAANPPLGSVTPLCPNMGLSKHSNPLFPHSWAFFGTIILRFQSNRERGLWLCAGCRKGQHGWQSFGVAVMPCALVLWGVCWPLDPLYVVMKG